MVSSILVFQLGQARVWFAMSRDRLLPTAFSRVHPRFRTPAFATWVAGILVAVPAGLFDVGTFAEMSNIGTLFAFVLVSVGVLVLRYKDPSRRRGFRVPFGPVIPVLSVLFCTLLMAGLPAKTWLRFFSWLIIGLLVYFFYSRKRSASSTGKHNQTGRTHSSLLTLQYPASESAIRAFPWHSRQDRKAPLRRIPAAVLTPDLLRAHRLTTGP